MEVSMQDRHVYCPFICSHAVWHTRKLLGRFFFLFCNPGTKPAVTDMSRCLRCGVRADTSRFVSAAAWMTVFSVYPSFALFMPVWLRALRVHVYLSRTSFPRTLLCGNRDAPSLTNKPCQGGGSKQCVTAALMCSVLPYVSCRPSTPKRPSKLCRRVLGLAQPSLWLVILDVLRQKPNTQQQQWAIRTCHSA